MCSCPSFVLTAVWNWRIPSEALGWWLMESPFSVSPENGKINCIHFERRWLVPLGPFLLPLWGVASAFLFVHRSSEEGRRWVPGYALSQGEGQALQRPEQPPGRGRGEPESSLRPGRLPGRSPVALYSRLSTLLLDCRVEAAGDGGTAEAGTLCCQWEKQWTQSRMYGG